MGVSKLLRHFMLNLSCLIQTFKQLMKILRDRNVLKGYYNNYLLRKVIIIEIWIYFDVVIMSKSLYDRVDIELTPNKAIQERQFIYMS